MKGVIMEGFPENYDIHQETIARDRPSEYSADCFSKERGIVLLLSVSNHICNERA